MITNKEKLDVLEGDLFKYKRFPIAKEQRPRSPKVNILKRVRRLSSSSDSEEEGEIHEMAEQIERKITEGDSDIGVDDGSYPELVDILDAESEEEVKLNEDIEKPKKKNKEVKQKGEKRRKLSRSEAASQAEMHKIEVLKVIDIGSPPRPAPEEKTLQRTKSKDGQGEKQKEGKDAGKEEIKKKDGVNQGHYELQPPTGTEDLPKVEAYSPQTIAYTPTPISELLRPKELEDLEEQPEMNLFGQPQHKKLNATEKKCKINTTDKKYNFKKLEMEQQPGLIPRRNVITLGTRLRLAAWEEEFLNITAPLHGHNEFTLCHKCRQALHHLATAVETADPRLISWSQERPSILPEDPRLK
jgi:hypothetical protein